MVYKWKRGSRFSNVKADPQAVGSIIAGIEKRKGDVSPSDVVASAKPKTSPLHNLFEWNNQKAAMKYREVQAGSILRALVVELEEEDGAITRTRAFVNIQKEDSNYSSITAVMSDASRRDLLLRQAMNELTAFKKRYKELSELAGVFAAMDAVAV